MGGRSKLVWRIGIAIILMANGLVFIGAVLLQSILGILAILGVAVFDLYCFCTVYKHRRKLQYPMVPPEGKGDIYLPRTDIPRPIHEDYRRMQERKRKFARIDRWRRRRTKKRA